MSTMPSRSRSASATEADEVAQSTRPSPSVSTPPMLAMSAQSLPLRTRITPWVVSVLEPPVLAVKGTTMLGEASPGLRRATVGVAWTRSAWGKASPSGAFVKAHLTCGASTPATANSKHDSSNAPSP